MRIRPYRAADENAVIALWRTCDLVRPENDPATDIARKLRVDAKWFLVAEAAVGLGSKQQVVGTVMAGYEGHRGWINYLAVAPDRRREGIGRALMAEAERRLRAVNCPKINLQVRASNAAVVAFYERLGFSGDAVVSMGKRLETDAEAVRRGAFAPKNRWGWWALVAVLLVGLGLRLPHNDVGYGHPDETITVNVVGHMRATGDWDTNWAKASELDPSFRYDQYNFSSYLYGTYFFYRAVKWVPGLEAWRSRDSGIHVYRMFSGLLAALVVGQAWWLARRLAGSQAGLVAGSLTAVVPLLIQDARYARPEAFCAVLTMAAVLWSVPTASGGRWRMFAAAVAVGLAIACKISMLPLVFLPFMPALWAIGTMRARVGRGLRVAPLILAGLFAGFAIGVPGALRQPEVFVHGVRYLASQYVGLHPPHSHLDGSWVTGMLTGYFLATLGLPLVVAGVVGGAWLGFRKRWMVASLLLAPVILFTLYFSTRSVFFERNLSHIVPLFCVAAAVGITGIAGRIAPFIRVRNSYVVAVLLALTVWRPLDVSCRLVWEVFSGRGGEQIDALESRLREEHPDVEWRREIFVNSEPIEQWFRRFRRCDEPLIVRVSDFNDEWTRLHLKCLSDAFDVEVLAVNPSIFADIPTSTLHTYNSWTDHFLLIRSIKTKPSNRGEIP